MFYTYLINCSENDPSKHKILTFESNTDLNKLIYGSCDLLLFGYFDGFRPDFNKLIISEYCFIDSPLSKEKLFEVDFNDIDKAKYYYNEFNFI